jgi:hypothetical protein
MIILPGGDGVNRPDVMRREYDESTIDRRNAFPEAILGGGFYTRLLRRNDHDTNIEEWGRAVNRLLYIRSHFREPDNEYGRKSRNGSRRTNTRLIFFQLPPCFSPGIPYIV